MNQFFSPKCRGLIHPSLLVVVLICFSAIFARATVRYVNVNSANPVSPYTDWDTAATTIQDAIDASVAGDQILVTNGVYAAGGKVVSGNLTNRVVLDKAVTVQSVNGPWLTSILGNGATNGSAAVRCAWLTNDAILSGFTLTGGATRSSGDTNLGCGGAAFCISSNAVISNCLIISNVAGIYGGGVWQGKVINSALIGNRAGAAGGPAACSSLLNCTITKNLTATLYYDTLVNCISYYNDFNNGFNSTYSYCCTYPLAAGQGNFTNAPQLLGDFVHLASTSPCRGTGTNIASGVDIDGQLWGNPPSIGCDDWKAAPAILGQPVVRFGSDPAQFMVTVSAVGQEPFTCYWMRDGSVVADDGNFSSSQSTNLVVRGILPSDRGAFQVVVSNSFGSATSLVTRVTIRYVDSANASPQSPYLSWASAATNVQDAIDVASVGDVVLVTNGTYAFGGKIMADDLVNRMALDKAIRVQSVNGPWVTTVSGNSATYGPTAVRVAWLSEGASLVGFTLSDGATRATGNSQDGGGVWCASSNAFVSNCHIRSNTASSRGGGVFQGTLNNSLIINNSTTIARGMAAVVNATLVNCTVVSNAVVGVSGGSLTNCIVYYNVINQQIAGCSYCCAIPLPAGAGNFTNAPSFLAGGIHLDNSSPCRGAGTVLGTMGLDIFGQPWASPPSVGCAERERSPLIGAQPKVQLTSVPIGFKISSAVAGEEPLAFSWIRNGMPIEDDGHYSSTKTTNLVANGINFSDAGDYQLVISNTFGVVTSEVARVVIHCVDAASENPTPPYLSWATAARNIQDAIDTSIEGEIVLVTNGVYASGGRAVVGGLTNRVVLDKPLTVISVNGYASTVIKGAWDTSTTNGLLATRCAWLGDGARLVGFTLRDGATHEGNFWTTEEQCGGGAWASTTNALLINCILTDNSAKWMGGAAYAVSLNNCLLIKNSAYQGGGTANATINNCTVANNQGVSGSGAAGTYMTTAKNCIITGNFQNGFSANTSGGSYAYCCSDSVLSGSGNIKTNVLFLDALYHLSATSPCRAVGNFLYASGSDADGEQWSNPPSMGWDEVVDANLSGPLSVSLAEAQLPHLVNRTLAFWGSITGRASRCDWSFGDGTIVTNTGSSITHSWTNAGDYTVTFTAYNNDNLNGVTTNLIVHIDPLIQPVLQGPIVTNNVLRFQFDTQVSGRYTVQYASNLAPPVVWQNLYAIFYGFGGPTEFGDDLGTNQMRFYRVLAQ